MSDSQTGAGQSENNAGVTEQKVSDLEGMLNELHSAFASRDLDKIMSFYAEDCIIDDVFTGEEIRGKLGMEMQIKRKLDALSDLKITLKNIVISGNRVAGEYVISGTYTGSYGPATGRYIAIPMALFYEIQDGKIKRMIDYYERLKVLHHLGMISVQKS
ncbi:nuclear transport factor 2 family protein [Thermodesulfobacteriota bacterium]